jgi:hypothetical protein
MRRPTSQVRDGQGEVARVRVETGESVQGPSTAAVTLKNSGCGLGQGSSPLHLPAFAFVPALVLRRPYRTRVLCVSRNCDLDLQPPRGLASTE